MRKREFKPGDEVMLLNGDMRKMKVIDYVVNSQKIDNWRYWENPIWEDDVLVECKWPDKLGLHHYDVFNEEDLLLLENQYKRFDLATSNNYKSVNFRSVK